MLTEFHFFGILSTFGDDIDKSLRLTFYFTWATFPRSTSRLVLPPGKYDRRVMSPFAELLFGPCFQFTVGLAYNA